MRPYGIGVEGHPKGCDCDECARLRTEFVKKLLAEKSQPRPPASLDATVFVRAHFRRQKNHMKRYPRTRQLMRAMFRGMK